jgi:hypothetical protein
MVPRANGHRPGALAARDAAEDLAVELELEVALRAAGAALLLDLEGPGLFRGAHVRDRAGRQLARCEGDGPVGRAGSSDRGRVIAQVCPGSGGLTDLVLSGRDGRRSEAATARHVLRRLAVDREIEPAAVVGRDADLGHGQFCRRRLSAHVHDRANRLVARHQRDGAVGLAITADETVVVAEVGPVGASLAHPVATRLQSDGSGRAAAGHHAPLHRLAVGLLDEEFEVPVVVRGNADLLHLQGRGRRNACVRERAVRRLVGHDRDRARGDVAGARDDSRVVREARRLNAVLAHRVRTGRQLYGGSRLAAREVGDLSLVDVDRELAVVVGRVARLGHLHEPGRLSEANVRDRAGGTFSQGDCDQSGWGAIGPEPWRLHASTGLGLPTPLALRRGHGPRS